MKRFIETGVVINAQASVVWKILTDTELWPKWGPSVADVRCRDRFITAGSAGQIKIIFGIWLSFEVTRFDYEKQWAWRVCHVNATGHRIETISHCQCRLIFEVPMLIPPYVIVCAIAARRIKKLAEEEQVCIKEKS